jgi:hypothetical protein
MSEITLLIEAKDIQPYAQIAVNAREEVMLHPYILTAQNVDVRPVIGNALLTDVIENRTDEKYRVLLDGGTYVVDGVTYTFQGLKAAIACFAYARYLPAKQVIDTPFGVVTKSSEFSEPADPKTISTVSSSKKSEGSAYLSECVDYIRNNEDFEFPLFDEPKSKSVSRPSIHKLTPANRI